jgi:hypothetical protein
MLSAVILLSGFLSRHLGVAGSELEEKKNHGVV